MQGTAGWGWGMAGLVGCAVGRWGGEQYAWQGEGSRELVMVILIAWSFK